MDRYIGDRFDGHVIYGIHNNKQYEGVHLKIGYPKSAGLSSYVPYQKCHCCAVYPLFRHTQIC